MLSPTAAAPILLSGDYRQCSAPQLLHPCWYHHWYQVAVTVTDMRWLYKGFHRNIQTPVKFWNCRLTEVYTSPHFQQFNFRRMNVSAFPLILCWYMSAGFKLHIYHTNDVHARYAESGPTEGGTCKTGAFSIHTHQLQTQKYKLADITYFQ